MCYHPQVSEVPRCLRSRHLHSCRGTIMNPSRWSHCQVTVGLALQGRLHLSTIVLPVTRSPPVWRQQADRGAVLHAGESLRRRGWRLQCRYVSMVTLWPPVKSSFNSLGRGLVWSSLGLTPGAGASWCAAPTTVRSSDASSMRRMTAVRGQTRRT